MVNKPCEKINSIDCVHIKNANVNKLCNNKASINKLCVKEAKINKLYYDEICNNNNSDSKIEFPDINLDNLCATSISTENLCATGCVKLGTCNDWNTTTTTIEGNAKINKELCVSKRLIVKGVDNCPSIFNKDLTVCGNLLVNKIFIKNGNSAGLAIGNDSIFEGEVTIKNKLTVNNDVCITGTNSNLTVDGNTILNKLIVNDKICGGNDEPVIIFSHWFSCWLACRSGDER